MMVARAQLSESCRNVVAPCIPEVAPSERDGIQTCAAVVEHVFKNREFSFGQDSAKI